MADPTPQDWLTRKRTEFGSFNLSDLNFLGWLLFLSTLFPMIIGIALLIPSTGNANPGGGDLNSQGMKRVFAGLMLVAMVAWFLAGKWMLGLVGLSIYRKGRR